MVKTKQSIELPTGEGLTNIMPYLAAYMGHTDFVADVIITEWLGELNKEGFSNETYFKAKIINQYKNNAGREYNIMK